MLANNVSEWRNWIIVHDFIVWFPESTCCKIKSGKYDCCPLANAVCCPSGIYCCPSGSSCNEKDGSCTTSSKLPILNPAFMSSRNVTLIPTPNDSIGSKCPDKKQECTAKETCCKLQTGDFGCCPYPGLFIRTVHKNTVDFPSRETGAVCCSDGMHCCPHGSQCDLKEQKCSRKGVELFPSFHSPEMKSWMGERKGGVAEKFNQEPQNVKNVLSAIICPGKEVQCPDE